MPIGPYKDFKSCMMDQMKKGKSEESAGKICGAMEKDMMKKDDMMKKKEEMMSKKFTCISNEIELALDENVEDKEFMILSIGKKVYRGGEIEITNDMLVEMAEHFQENLVGTQLALDMNHDPEHIAFAWLKDVFVKGGALYMTLKDITEEGKKLLSKGMFKYFSVEFTTRFEKIVNGVKTIFNNVLLGVAMTNRPVDKSLNATFSEDNFIQSNILKMETFRKMLSDVKSLEKISESDITKLKGAFLMLSDEEQEEVKEELEAVEATPDESEEKADVEAELAEAKKQLAEFASKAKLSDSLRTKLSEMQSQVDKMQAEARTKELAERVKEELTLSQTKPAGLNAEAAEKLVKLLSELTDKQTESIFEIIKGMKSVALAEAGHSQKNVVVDFNDNDADISDEIQAKAMELAKKEGMTYGKALKKFL